MLIESKSSVEIRSYSQRKKGFHEKYLSICKTKLLQPLPEVKIKQNNIHVLDFHADRIKANDWIAISEALKNDKTLKYVTIKLRKNDEYVLEHVDTLKKSRNVVSIPVIYSKFIFNEFIESLQGLLVNNNILELLSLEGFPIRDRFMMTLAKGCFTNRSIRVLNLSRSKIGDDGCEILCSNIKHLTNIETLNLSNCNIGIKGVNAVVDYIKTQKIHRFSEAWIRSLRYQNINDSSFGGLKRILLNSNPQIGDEGLKLLTDELSEDVWIKDIEVQNCGLTHVAANEIIACLNYNKTILNFNVANNLDLPEHMHRQILERLGSCDVDSGDSNESKPVQMKVTKSQLYEKIKFLENQLELEAFQQKQMKELIQSLHNQNMEYNKQIIELNEQLKQNVPDGFTLVANEHLDRMAIRKTASNVAVRLRRRRRHPIKKVRSLVIESPINKVVNSKSVTAVKLKPKNVKEHKAFVEQNIGDSMKNDEIQQSSSDDDDEEFNGASLLKSFVARKSGSLPFFENIAQSSSSRVPYNSDDE
ncbi:protein Cep78 homolog [Chironomus tepperi]|uniref:protein Cep78 homolog n=1 Tax=Chironomus tepperi TaxID=113505 RepID=UPI00391F72DC